MGPSTTPTPTITTLHTYAVYERFGGGNLVRMPALYKPTAALSREQRESQFPHAERLLGWPERVVYWAHETGASMGVAPMSGGAP
jgi:hypothetical protein